jgi:hypothetical protein
MYDLLKMAMKVNANFAENETWGKIDKFQELV